MPKTKRTSREVVKATAYRYTVLFEPAPEGGYTVTVPMLPGAITEADTLEQARMRAREVIRGYLKVLQKHGERIPVEKPQGLKRPIAERVAVTV